MVDVEQKSMATCVFGFLKRDDWQVVSCIVKHKLHKKRICDVGSSLFQKFQQMFLSY